VPILASKELNICNSLPHSVVHNILPFHHVIAFVKLASKIIPIDCISYNDCELDVFFEYSLLTTLPFPFKYLRLEKNPKVIQNKNLNQFFSNTIKCI
jgi:hypothetical protein